jgi:hypothetical protein
MNYFTIGGRTYRTEIREGSLSGRLAHGSGDGRFAVVIEAFSVRGWGTIGNMIRDSRSAARRALGRALEHLAIGPDGKRANWQIVRRGPSIRIRVDVSRALHGLYRVSDAIRRFGAEAERASAAFGDLNRALAQGEGSGARKIIERAAAKVEIPVGEFVRRVRGEVRS